MAETATPPPYFPVEDGPYRPTMGLRSLKAADWIEIDGEFKDDLREKRRLHESRRAEVFAELEGSEEAQREVLEQLGGFLPERFPGHFSRDGRHVTIRDLGETVDLDSPDRPALETAGLMVQEDLCLMRPHQDTHILVAASLSFPSRWRLADKIGKPMAAIHAPVPDYDARLATPLDRFFTKLRVDKPVWRLNWSLLDDPALFQPTGHSLASANPAVTAENAGETVTFRVERQTLRRLPLTGDILFTIRIHRSSLASVAADENRAARLLEAIRQMPQNFRIYKSLETVRAAAAAYLEKRLA